MAYKVFANGFPLQASELNINLMQQAIATFSSASARSTEILTPVIGQFTFLTDTQSLEYWDSTQWKAFSAGGGGGVSEFLLMGA